MSNTFTVPTTAPQPWGRTALLFPGSINPPGPQAREWQTNQRFIAMLNDYRPSGGLARAPEVAAMFNDHGASDFATLANWIIQRKVISFEWQAKIWLPLFQFNLIDMRLQPGLGEVLTELVVALDDWEVAIWFSQPNPWLAACTPADSLASVAPEVRNAARAERYTHIG